MSTQPSASGQTPRTDAATEFVYAVYSWRGRSPQFMQTQVGKLRQLIDSQQTDELTTALHRITDLEVLNVALAIETSEKMLVMEAERDAALQALETCRANFTIQSGATTTIGEELNRVETDRDELCQRLADDTARLDRIEAGLIVGHTEHGWYAGMPGTTAYDARTLRDAIDGATQP